MIRRIIWSPVAVQTYQQILDYLESNWTLRELLKFIHRTEEILEHISINPQLYQQSRKSGLTVALLRNKSACFIGFLTQTPLNSYCSGITEWTRKN